MEGTGPYNEAGCRRLNLAILVQAILDYRQDKSLRSWLLSEGHTLLTANSDIPMRPEIWAKMVDEGFPVNFRVYKH